MKFPSLSLRLRSSVAAAALFTSGLQAADTPPAAAPAPELSAMLQQALMEEETTRDLEKAAAGYDALLTKWTEQRRIAAAALFRLAEVRRKQNRSTDAIPLYQRLLREFPDMEPHARLSRENLTALGAKPAPVETPGAVPSPASPGQPTLSDEEEAALARVQKIAVESPDLLGLWHLQEACRKGHLSVLKFLHGKGVRDNGEGLFQVAAAGQLQLCAELLAQKPKPDLIGAAMFKAVEGRRTAVLKLLLETGTPPRTVLLSRAIQLSQPVMVDLLLEHKIPVNDSGSVTTPLFAAAGAGDPVLVERLLKLGANPREGGTAPASSGPPGPNRQELIDSVWQGFAGSTPLHAAVRYGHTACIAALLKAGADPNAVNENGWTPLQVAAKRGSVDVVNQLIEAGARPGPPAPGGSSRPILILGFESGSAGVVEALLKAGCDPNVTYGEDRPAVTYLEAFQDAGTRDTLARLMIERGVPPGEAASYASPAVCISLLRDHHYGQLAGRPEVTLVFASAGRVSTLATKGTENAPGESLSSLLLQWGEKGWRPSLLADSPLPDWTTASLYRRGADGKMTVTPVPVKARAALPPLQWGDVIEVVSPPGQPVKSTGNGPVAGRFPNSPSFPDMMVPPPRKKEATPENNSLGPVVTGILRDMQSVRVKLTAGDITKDLVLRGHLRTWNPLASEAPLVPLSLLCELSGAGSSRVSSGATVRLRRKPGAGGGVDAVYRASDSALTSLFPREGDEIFIVPATAVRSGIREGFFSSPGQIAGGEAVPRSGSSTLFQFLANLYAAPLPGTWAENAFKPDGTPGDPATLPDKLTDQKTRFRVLPHPDLSRIRILHNSGFSRDRDKKTTDVDLLRMAESLPGDATGGDVRKLDIPVNFTDRVEIPLLPGASADQPWSGLPASVERLLSLATASRVTLDDQKGGLRAVEVRWLPARWVNTPAGLLPVPAPPANDGSVSLSIPTAQGLNRVLFGDTKTASLTRGGEMISQEAGAWLLDGDRIILTEANNIPRPPSPAGTPRVTPLPPPINTTRIP